MFNAGALLFQIKTVGAQLAQQDLRQTDQAFERTGKSAEAAGKKVDEQGNATDRTASKARGAKGPLDEQARSTEKVGDESKKAAPKQEEQAKAAERQAETAGKLSVALLAAGVAVSALVGLSVAKWAEFDEGMSQVAAATLATREEQEALADSALEAGADTAYSAREAAGAQEELAKAGLETSQIIGGGLGGSLALAAAGQLEVARSAELMATTLTQFRLPAQQAAHVADVLAASAGKAQGSVDDMGLALTYVGPLAQSMGWSLEETAGTIAYFASQGILGEKAGTGLRGVLAALQAPSAMAAKVMSEYGIQVYDASGKMVSASQLAEQFRTKLGGLTDQERQAALGRIFGNESLLAATLLYEGGAEKVEEWTEAVDATGYAAQQAAMRQDNLRGDVEKLGGAFDTALIKTGSGSNDVLRDMVQMVTALVDWYGELPDGVQQTALVLGVATGAMLLFSGSALGAISRFAELRKTLEAANLTLGRTALIAGGVGLALTGVLTVVAMVASAQAEARQKAESYAAALEAGADAASESMRNLAKDGLAAEQSWLWISRGSAYDAAEKLGLSLETVTDAALGNADALDDLDLVMRAFRGSQSATEELARQSGLSFVDAASAATLLGEAIEKENSGLERGAEITRQKKEATEEGVPVTKSAAEAYVEAAEGAEELNIQLSELIDQIMEANGIGQDAISANIDYKDALFAVDETIRQAREGVEGYALTLDESTQVGRDNKAMLVGLAEDAQQAAEAQFKLDGNTANYRATLEASRQALIDRATQLGMNSDEAGALADQIFRIPSETEWEVIAKTAQAAADLQNFITTWDGRQININLSTPNQAFVMQNLMKPQANGGKVEFYADGGRSEQHIAQFARAGTWRVWAEPETGGEWYLPETPAKRGRSLAIAEQMLAGWGYQMVPVAEAQNFAAGSPVGARAAGSGGQRIVGELTLVDGGRGLYALIDATVQTALDRESDTAARGVSNR